MPVNKYMTTAIFPACMRKAIMFLFLGMSAEIHPPLTIAAAKEFLPHPQTLLHRHLRQEIHPLPLPDNLSKISYKDEWQELT
jgi:hypothetical protein